MHPNFLMQIYYSMMLWYYRLQHIIRWFFLFLYIFISPVTILTMKLCTETITESKVHGANMGPTSVLSAPDGPHVGPMNLAIRVVILTTSHCWRQFWLSSWCDSQCDKFYIFHLFYSILFWKNQMSAFWKIQFIVTTDLWSGTNEGDEYEEDHFHKSKIYYLMM